MRASSASELAPTPVSAEAGALSYGVLDHGGLTAISGSPFCSTAQRIRAERFVFDS